MATPEELSGSILQILDSEPGALSRTDLSQILGGELGLSFSDAELDEALAKLAEEHRIREEDELYHLLEKPSGLP